MSDAAVSVDYADHVRSWLTESAAIKQELAAGQAPAIVAAAKALAQAFEAGHKLLTCGNGGSAADAQHIAAEFVVRLRPENLRRALPAIALPTDSSVLTACANDYDFERIFVRQVEALGQAGDILLAISTSGNSLNIVHAAEEARERGMTVIAFTGRTGGRLKGVADHVIRVPSDDVLRIQESHITLGHILCHLVDKQLFNL